jgi:hypothetical protein
VDQNVVNDGRRQPVSFQIDPQPQVTTGVILNEEVALTAATAIVT